MAQRKVGKSTKRKKQSSVRSKQKLDSANFEFIFTKSNFVWMGIGLAFIALGMLLMLGGTQPDPNTWNPDEIYSFRRITLAPILILTGFVIEVYAILKRDA